jgi:hypothetical protein
MFLIFLPFQLFGQGNFITGIISDEVSGEPLPGVTVIVKGTTQGTISDINGAFSIKASSDQTLTFSYIGYATLDVPVGENLVLNISLTEESTELDELVVIGYGTVKKADATGSVSTVSSKDFNKGSSRWEKCRCCYYISWWSTRQRINHSYSGWLIFECLKRSPDNY